MNNIITSATSMPLPTLLTMHVFSKATSVPGLHMVVAFQLMRRKTSLKMLADSQLSAVWQPLVFEGLASPAALATTAFFCDEFVDLFHTGFYPFALVVIGSVSPPGQFQLLLCEYWAT